MADPAQFLGLQGAAFQSPPVRVIQDLVLPLLSDTLAEAMNVLSLIIQLSKLNQVNYLVNRLEQICAM